MKQAVIDIGSNSVRLMMWEDGKVLSKEVVTTRLGEGTALTNMLSDKAMERTAKAVKDMCISAKERGAENVYAFATEAVRSAGNGDDFLQMVNDMSGLCVDVIDGTKEAEYGAAGALKGSDGTVIDVGGASCEVTRVEDGKVISAVSLPVGAVRLRDISGGEREKAEKAVAEHLSRSDFPDCPGKTVTAIGGTATALAAVYLGLVPYDPNEVDGTVLSRAWIEKFSENAFGMSPDEIKEMKGMDPRRTDTIAGGALILSRLAAALNADSLKVSESDNMEGYILSKTAK